MTARISLCIDPASCTSPESIGLAGEKLDSQAWLAVQTNGAEARDALRSDDRIEEVWVASCDDVEPINLAASLKSDRPELIVRLLGAESGGSLLSRAQAASIDEVMSRKSFVERYGLAKSFAKGQSTPPISGGASFALPATIERQDEGAGLAVKERRSGDSPLYPQASDTTLTTPLSVTVVSAPQRQGNGFLLPVVSGSGGAGKSTVALLAAWAAHAMGYKALLLDYDLQFGDVAFMAGVETPLTIDEALVRPDKVEQEAGVLDRPALIAAPARLEMAEGIVHAMPEFLRGLSQAFDVIVANTGAAWAEQHAVLLERSSSVLFLVDQRSSSLRACRHALELCARCGIATGQFQFALNRCSKNSPLSTMDISCALQGSEVEELKDGGRDVEDYLAAGAAAELVDSGNALYESVRQFVAKTLPAIEGAPAAQMQETRGKASGRRRGRHVGRRKGWGK